MCAISSFRAAVDWRAHRDTDGKAANANANELLNKALAMAPDDQYALRQVAIINLCDCVNAWSSNPDEQKAIGAAAMEKYLRIDPSSHRHARGEGLLSISCGAIGRNPW